MPFDHPFFQIILAYLGEFVFTIIYYLYMGLVMRHWIQATEIRFRQFMYPALCDFTEQLLFIFGLSMALPSMSIMTKALALPISAGFSRWAILRLNKTYNWYQITGLICILVSIVWIFLVSIDLKAEWKSQNQGLGLTLLTLAACFQAFQISLENRIFMIEPDISALTLQ